MDLLSWCLILALVIGFALGLGVLLAVAALKFMDWVYSKWQV